MADVESKQRKLEAEKSTLKEKLAKVMKDSEAFSSSMRDRIDKLTKLNIELKLSEKTLQSSLSRSQAEQIRHEEACKMLREQVDSDKSELARLHRENEALSRAKTDLERQLEEKLKEFASLEAELEHLLDQQVSEVSRLKRSLDEQAESEAVTVRTLQQDHDEAVAKLKVAKKLIKHQNKIFHTLDSKLESTLAAISTEASTQ